ncbi:MAG TPA: methyltransferase, partial [Aquabacterium sp.]|nr:methyltransferase [Aquabacterium sp.]
PQLLSPPPLRPILQHGIHLGQEAEMLTDGLRALLLDAAGYDTQVFEFISLEHTNKNKMILAVKRAAPQSNAVVLQQIAEIKAFYGIQEQCLETLLRADGTLPAAA